MKKGKTHPQHKIYEAVVAVINLDDHEPSNNESVVEKIAAAHAVDNKVLRSNSVPPLVEHTEQDKIKEIIKDILSDSYQYDMSPLEH